MEARSRNQGKSQFCEDCTGLGWEAIANILSVTISHQIAGIIATNTTIRRDGLKTQVCQPASLGVPNRSTFTKKALVVPLRDRSTEVIRFIWKQTQGQLPIIA